MSDFIIPKNKDFSFTVKVMEQDSFIAQDLTNMDAATFKVFDKTTQTCVFEQALTIPADTVITPAISEVPAVQNETLVSVATVSDTTLYYITVDGTYYSYTSDTNATSAEIAAGLVASMAVAVVVPTDNLDGTLTLVGPDTNLKPNISVSNNMFYETTIEADAGTAGVPEVTSENTLDGKLEATIVAAKTNLLDVTRGPLEDNYYLKPGYQATIDVTFTDSTLPVNVLIEKVYVSPTGGTCA